jgi:ectoine hydroxylase-related dioxygenase (phytanoyl-CoA dioxygenase family)
MSRSDLMDSYHKDGFAIARGAFKPGNLLAVADSMRYVLEKGHVPNGQSIDGVIMEREQEDHDLVYKASHALGSSSSTYRLLGQSPILEMVAQLWGVRETQVHLTPMYLIAQLPSDGRFDYTWHQDAAYYRRFREVLTLWFPITHAASVENGTISVLSASHLQGMRAAATHQRHGFFRQIEAVVAEDEQQKPLNMEVGDCCLLHGHSVHRSVANRSAVPRVTGVVRLVNLAHEDVYDRELFYCTHK